MHQLQTDRQAYLDWQADVMAQAMAEVGRMAEAGETFRDPDAPPTLDEQLFREREATRN